MLKQSWLLLIGIMLSGWGLEQVQRAVVQYSLSGPVLDVGAADHHELIRELFQATGHRYWSVDKDGSEGVDIIAIVPREKLPMIHGIQTALILSMLEHAFVPNTVVKWTTSKMAPSGKLLVLAPMLHATMLSPDLWRFMPDGVKWLLRGLTIKELISDPTDTDIFAVAEKPK